MTQPQQQQQRVASTTLYPSDPLQALYSNEAAQFRVSSSASPVVRCRHQQAPVEHIPTRPISAQILAPTYPLGASRIAYC